MRFRLIALDADGTALDPDGRVRPAVRAAVGAAQQRGVRVVLCTGRRYRTALPILEALELDGAAVVHNGAVVKDAHNGATLHHNYLPRDLYPVALSIMRKLGPPLVYVDHYHENLDLVTETPERSHPYQEEYWRDNTDVGRVVDSLDRPPSDALVREQGKMIAKAEDFFLEKTQNILQTNLHAELERYLGPKGIIVDAVLVRDINLPAVLTQAIEQKKEREQAVERQKAELERFRTEQLEKVALAQAERKAAEEEFKRRKILADARAYEINQINKAVARNPAYIQLQALEALKSMSKDPAAKIYFMDANSPQPLPLMHMGDALGGSR